MEPTIIGVKELYRELPRISQAVKRGQSFLVFKHTKPVFRIEPVHTVSGKKYHLKDFEKIQFTDRKDLSKQIDKIAYGV